MGADPATLTHDRYSGLRRIGFVDMPADAVACAIRQLIGHRTLSGTFDGVILGLSSHSAFVRRRWRGCHSGRTRV